MNEEDEKVDETTSSPSDEMETTSEIDFNQDIPDEGADQDEAAPRKKSAAGRINELISQNRQLLDEMRDLKEKVETPTYQPAPAPAPQVQAEDPNVERAIELLKSKGFTTKEELDSRIKQIEDRQVLNGEHSRFENDLDGEDGRPKYDRQKVENYMREHGIWDPQAAYREMNFDELVDWELKKAEGKARKGPIIEKGSSTAGTQQNAITREKVEEALKNPQGKAWYERNRTKILDLMAKGQL